MRTTVSIPEDLLREAKVLAAREDRTVSSVLEQALRRLLTEAAESSERRRTEFSLPVIHGGRWLVDINDNSAVLDALDQP
ncbi:MAG: ribbon-helix-helix protein, CopG family [Nostocoides sp.]